MFSMELEIASQSLQLYKNGQLLRKYSISTAKNGVGEVYGSEQTPRGRHLIRAKIGSAASPNTVFVGRRKTGELYDPSMRVRYPHRDWILTRILWLSGLELGLNRLGVQDTMRRYIYIHGSPDDVIMGVPGSHGCIRMRNDDIIELFDLVPVYTQLIIK